MDGHCEYYDTMIKQWYNDTHVAVNQKPHNMVMNRIRRNETGIQPEEKGVNSISYSAFPIP